LNLAPFTGSRKATVRQHELRASHLPKPQQRRQGGAQQAGHMAAEA